MLNFYAVTGDCVEILGLLNFDASALCLFDYGFSEGMLRVFLCHGGELQDLLFAQRFTCPVDWDDVCNFGFALREGSGLIKNDGFELMGCFECFAAFD